MHEHEYTTGTSIAQLQQQQQQQQNMNPHNQQHFQNQAHELQNQPHQLQQYTPQYLQAEQNMANNQQIEHFQPHQKTIYQGTNAKELGIDINNYLDINKNDSDAIIDDIDLDDDALINKIPPILREPIIIFIIYLLLSHPKLRTQLEKYIKFLNPDENGEVSITGIIVYGAILSLSFMGIKHLLKKYLAFF